ncbi:MAG: hypothetical protein WAR21_00105 [Candidatus Acidiferrales bacterium]
MTAPLRFCRLVGCGQDVPATLTREVLCLDHFIEQASTRMRKALELCRLCRPLDRHILDWLLADADFVLRSVTFDGRGHTPVQRAKLLELVLGLANLQEYLRHHSVQVKLAD